MKFDEQAIRDYWRRQAIEHGAAAAASWTDVHAIHLEINAISRHLRDGMRVIDIGCANGYSTLSYAAQHDIDIKGVDYIPEMVAAAHERLNHATGLKGRASFGVGTIASLAEPAGVYDAAIVTRVVINLASTEQQTAAIRESARVLKSGGLLLMSEATEEGLARLNAFRVECGLEPVPEPPFNRYVNEDLARSAAADMLELECISNFASTYFVGTRVVKPLLLRAAGRESEAANPGSAWNEFFAQLPAWGDFGTQKLFVFRRR